MKGALCPVVEMDRKKITLTCESALADARPRGAEALPREEASFVGCLGVLAWMDRRPCISPEFTGMAAPCPSDTPAGKGECAFLGGEFLPAAKWFRRALRSSDRGFASLRLGDLSLIAGDPAAFTWFKKVSIIGPVGRLAGVRLCELNIACIERHPDLNDNPQDLPDPFRDDIMLRQARAAAFEDDILRALGILFHAFDHYKSDSLCKGGGWCCVDESSYARCHAARGQEDKNVVRSALSLYSMLPDREIVGLGPEPAQEAGEMAARMGAPVYGANLMSRVTGLLSGADQGTTLYGSLNRI